MLEPEAKERYLGAKYIRISKDDGDKLESNSISNQREFIDDFLKKHGEIQIVEEKVDDGYSGVTFERPAFKELMSDIKAGKINCVIVKDLSRFGRNYIETGRYLEKLFPFLGVRFIAINDGYDSAEVRSQFDSIILPFRNLINDSYIRDISIKVRSQLEVRRRRGEYAGAFPAYGYVRSGINPSRLAVDEEAAENVRNMFKWKLEGLSSRKIADRLNERGALPPLEYKERRQWTFSKSFKADAQANWSAQTVARILKNEIYTGVLIQGRESTPNYKIKKRIKKPRAEWSRTENAHEAIISREVFYLVNKLMRKDTRIAPGKSEIYLFSGLLQCGGCKGDMVRKPVSAGGKSYHYYLCAVNKEDRTRCGSHRINEQKLMDGVLGAIRVQIQLLGRDEKAREPMRALPRPESREFAGHQLERKKKELSDHQMTGYSLYESLKSGLLTKEEYKTMLDMNRELCRKTKQEIRVLEAEAAKMQKKETGQSRSAEAFGRDREQPELSRVCLVMLVERIVVKDKNRIELIFRYRDEFNYC